jgi:vacuolar-type H+-ATPase subunit E/Vma4
MGTAQNDAAGIGNPQIDSERGKGCMTVDEIKEAADANAWEALNAIDPRAEKAREQIKQAVLMIEQAEKALQDAAEAVENTTHGDVIESYLSDLEFLETDLRLQIERMK